MFLLKLNALIISYFGQKHLPDGCNVKSIQYIKMKNVKTTKYEVIRARKSQKNKTGDFEDAFLEMFLKSLILDL